MIVSVERNAIMTWRKFTPSVINGILVYRSGKMECIVGGSVYNPEWIAYGTYRRAYENPNKEFGVSLFIMPMDNTAIVFD